MKEVRTTLVQSSNKEEILPEFSEEFPYIATHTEYDHFVIPTVPWHWHNALELFYIERGELHYVTPGGEHIFPAGSGGLINSGVLHASHWDLSQGSTIQFLHFFDPEFLSGKAGSRIDQNYVRPLVYQSGMDVLPLYPDCDAHAPVLRMIREAFDLSESDFGFEFQIRQRLCDIWLRLAEIAEQTTWTSGAGSRPSEQIKQMMIYVHEHYAERISVDDLAQAAHLSKRACFRVFQENLHMTPVEYIQSYRLQIACQLLADEKFSITEIAYRCGMGSSSYFGKVFREAKGCTPLEYRRLWHDHYK